MLKILKPAIVLFLACVIVTGLLAVTYSATKDVIALREEETQREARERVLGGAAEFEMMDEDMLPDEPEIISVHIGKDTNGAVVGAVISLGPKGYANKVIMSVGIRIDGMVEGVMIIDHEETPGLGAKITEDWFISQFSMIKSDNGFTVVKTVPETDTQIQAISGATISSRAVTEGVNKARHLSTDIFMKAGDLN